MQSYALKKAILQFSDNIPTNAEKCRRFNTALRLPGNSQHPVSGKRPRTIFIAGSMLKLLRSFPSSQAQAM